MLALRMANNMDPWRHGDGDTAAILGVLSGFGGVLSHSVQLQLSAGICGLAVQC